MQQQGVEVTVQESARVAVFSSLQVQDNLFSIREQVAALVRHQCAITFIPTDFLQIHNLYRSAPYKTETMLRGEAFELGVQWLKDFAELFIELKQKGTAFKILPMHQIMHDGLKIQKIDELFGKPDDDSSEALVSAKAQAFERIDTWAERVREILAKTSVLNPLSKNVTFAEAESIIAKLAAGTNSLGKGYQASVRKYVSKHRKFATEEHLHNEAAVNVYCANSGEFDNTHYVRGRLPGPLVYIETHILKDPMAAGQSKLPHLIYHEGKLVIASTLPLSPPPEKRSRAPSDGSSKSSGTFTPERRSSLTDEEEEVFADDKDIDKFPTSSPPQFIPGANPGEDNGGKSISSTPPDVGSIDRTPPGSVAGSPVEINGTIIEAKNDKPLAINDGREVVITGDARPLEKHGFFRGRRCSAKFAIKEAWGALLGASNSHLFAQVITVVSADDSSADEKITQTPQQSHLTGPG